METVQQFMYAFFAVLMLAAAGICVWYCKKRPDCSPPPSAEMRP
jgi:Mg2+ and Co2+ transporter CorA